MATDDDDPPVTMIASSRLIIRSASWRALAASVAERLTGDAARAAAAGDDERVRHLLDVCYDLEAWAPVDLGDVRDHLAAALENGQD